MKKQIILSMVVATMTLGTVGCGSDDKILDPGADTPSTELPDTGTPPSGDENSDDIEIRSNAGLVISRNSSTNDVEMSFEHNQTNDRVLFYVDIDDNADTGSVDKPSTDWTEFIGAEYLVERDGQNSYLKELNASKDWVVSATNAGALTYNSGTLKDTIIVKNIIQDSYFSVTAMDFNQSWENLGVETKIIFDMRLASSGAPLTINGDNGLSMEVDKNDTHMSIKLIGSGYSDKTEIHIDSDDMNTTGYVSRWKNLGADYYIGITGNLYKRSDDNTSWELPLVVPYIVKNNSINFNISRATIGNPVGDIRIGTAPDYSNVAVSIPSISANNDASKFPLN